jgi:hypothetical protein
MVFVLLYGAKLRLIENGGSSTLIGMKRSPKGKAKTRCFVIMPFSDTIHSGPKTTSASQWTHIYNKWIKRAVESFPSESLSCSRSLAVPGNFVRGIISDLSEADLVIADLTGTKANVFYELGIRHALRTGTILISQDLSSVPSDLKSYYTFGYRYTNEAHEYEEYFKNFESELHEKIEAFLSGKILTDSPVSDFLGFRYEVFRQQLDAERVEIRRLVEACGAALGENYNVCEFLLKAVRDGTQIELERFPVIDTVAIDALYGRLLSVRLDLIGASMTENLRAILAGQRHSLLSFFLIGTSEGAANLIFMLEYLVTKQKPIYLRMWPKIIKGIDEIKAGIVIKSGRKKKKISMPGAK